MKPVLRLDPGTWLRAMAVAQLDLGVTTPGFRTYGTPRSPWGHRGRTLDMGILYLLVNGGIRARLPDGTFELTEGSLFLMGPGVRHDFELLSHDQPITLYHLRLQPRIDGRACWLREDAICLRHMLGLRPYFDEMLSELDGASSWSAERVRALLFLAFSSAFRSTGGTSGRGLTLTQQARIARFLREQRGNKPRPADLANELGLSLDYFSRLFKVSYGVIPRVWLVRERLRIASLDLAESRKSISQVAEDLGYESLFLFSRQFSREFGCSPRAFRQRHLTGVS